MKVALLGGRSRAARAFRALAPALAPDLTLVPVVRGGATASDERDALVVDDYSDVGPAMFGGFDAAINFVGSARARSEAASSRINTELAVHMAIAARAAGVTRFIQLGSLAVYGPARLIDADTPPAPASPYGRAKLAADSQLLSLGSRSFVVTALRVPAIYGRDRPSKLAQLASALRLLRLFSAPAPFPRRSIISEQNLVRCLVHLLRSPQPGVALAADPQPFLIDEFARMLPFRARILPAPAALFTPVRWLAPTLYASLFTPSEIAADVLLRDIRPPLVATEAALRDAFGAD